MQIIDMPWEIKNLGKRSVSMVIDSSDDLNLIKENIEAISDYEYQVIKAPIERMDVAYILQENGFVFAETAFDLSLKLKNLKCPDTYTRYIDYTSYSEASSEEVQLVDSEIRKGIFNTDKVALDPLMSTELSGQRFANWFTTEVESGKSKCYLVNLEDKPIGFFGVKDVNEKKADSFLAGLFDNDDGRGFGISTIYYPLLVAKESGKKTMTARVSSNNPNSLKVHLELGYKIDKMHYVYVKHNDNK